MFNLNTRSGQLFSLFALALVWGSSFILMKRGLESYNAYQVGAFRMFFASLFFTPVIVKHIKKVNRQNVFWLLFVGFIGNFIPAFLFTTAQTQISSSLSGMLNALTPFFALAIGYFVFKSNVRWWNVFGVVTGLVGASGLIAAGAQNILSGDIRYAGLVVLATACYGTTVNVIKYKLSDMGGVTVAALAMMFVGPVAAIYLLASDFSPALQTADYLENLAYVVVLAVFGTTLALMAFNTLIHKTSPLFASSVTYIVPIFAILWGVADGETVSLLQYACMGIILLGVYLVNKR